LRGCAVEAGRSCGRWGDSVRRIIDASSCPRRAATPLRVAAQSRPMPSERSERWAPALQRTVAPDHASLRRGDAALRPGHGRTQSSDQSRSDLQTAGTPPPSRGAFARALPDRITLAITRAQGRPGAGWHPQVRAPKECTRGGPQVGQSPGLPCAMVYGLLRALPGERCTIAPVAPQMADARARSGGRHHYRT
jgi:hypothetical protein